MSSTTLELPRYTCHKKVRALHLNNVGWIDGKMMLYPMERGYPPFEAPAGYETRCNASPDDPGVYVVYDDGYASWSPTKVFDEGYTLDEESATPA
jgi:hypothetical protein